MISVIISLYNKEKYIERCLLSIFNQSFQDFEIIVINDGTTDNSLNIVKSYNNNKIRIFEQGNLGHSAGRNKGIIESYSDLITFIDADDEWHPHFLERVFELSQTYPSEHIFATAYQYIYLNNKVQKAKYSFINEHKVQEYIINNYYKYSLLDNLLSGISVLFRKNVFKKVGFFNEKIKRGLDIEMWIRIADYYNIVFSNNYFANYNKNVMNSISDIAIEREFLLSANNFSLNFQRNKEFNFYKYEYLAKERIHEANILIKKNNSKKKSR